MCVATVSLTESALRSDALADSISASGLSAAAGCQLLALRGWSLPAVQLATVFGINFATNWTSNAATTIIALPIIAALAQGMVLGALLQGIEVTDRAYSGSWWDWLTPYTLLTGVGTLAGYALLGATWLVWKLDGDAQNHARKLGKMAALATLALMGAISLMNLFVRPEYAEHWLSAPEIYWVAPIPIATLIVAGFLWHALSCDRHSKPFWLSLALFLFGLAGVGVTIWPYVVPPGITIWDAAAPERSQVFMLVGVAITMPLIIAYTAWAYWVFRGKVGDEGYH